MADIDKIDSRNRKVNSLYGSGSTVKSNQFA
jgi:hypothetical protein